MQNVTVQDVLNVFWQHTKPYRGRIFFSFLLISCAAVLEILQPWYLKKLFDLLEQQPATTATIAIFLPIIITLLGLKLINWAFWRIIAILNVSMQAQVMANLEQSAFENLLGHSYKFFADHFTGSLVKKVGRLSRAYERLADEIEFHFIPMAIILIGSVIGLYLRYPLLAIMFVAWTVFYFVFSLAAARWAAVTDVEKARLDSVTGGALADAIGNAVRIKLFASFHFEVTRFQQALQDFARALRRAWSRHELIFAVQALFMIGFEMALMYIGVILWLRGILTLGDLAFIQTALIIVFSRLWELSRTFRHVFDAFADGKEMVEIMNPPRGIRARRGPKPLKVKEGRIAFKQVTFSFENKPILKDFSLLIKPKEKIALVGPSGAGKSTLTKLLFR